MRGRGLLRFAAGLALAAFAVSASARPCFPPGEGTPIQLQGKNLMEGYHPTHQGTWRAIWCPTGTFNETTGETWKLSTHAVLDKYATVRTQTIIAAGLEVMRSADPLTTLEAVLKQGEYIPPVGTQDRFDWESLLYIACTEGVKQPPFPGVPVTNNCRPATPLTSPPPEVWRVPAGGPYPVYAMKGTTLGARVSGVTVAGGTLADCSRASVMIGSARYCSVNPAGQVALVRKVTQ